MCSVLDEPYASVYHSFLEYEKLRVSEQGYQTIKTIAYRVIKWHENNGLPFEQVNMRDILSFKKYISERTNKNGNLISNGTVCNYIKAARRLYKFLMASEKVRTNPFYELSYPRNTEHISRNVLTESQMNRLLGKMQEFDREENRKRKYRRYLFHVLAEVLYATGLRIDEACRLHTEDVDVRHRYVHVKNGKGGKARTAFLTGYAADILALYIEKGKASGDALLYGGRRALLFSNKKDTLAQAFNKELRRLCTELELPVITTHAFRHSLGTHLLRAGCDMRHIQVILGHDKLSSTQIYTKVYSDDLKQSLDEYHPRQRMKDLNNGPTDIKSVYFKTDKR